MIETIVSLLILIGSLVILIGAIGLVRLPDVYTRIHAAGLVTTAGIGALFIAELVHFSATGGYLSIKGLMVLVFVLVTLPVGAHMLGRAAYKSGVPMADCSVIDERGGRVPPPPASPSGSEVDEPDRNGVIVP